jgi:hypothetical protein
MVIRINAKLTPQALETLNQQYDHLLSEGHIAQRESLPEEADDRDLAHLPRLVLIPHKREFGLLRILINAINDSATLETGGEGKAIAG